MDSPDSEETLKVPPSTAEAVVAELVKSEGSEKDAVKSFEATEAPAAVTVEGTTTKSETLTIEENTQETIDTDVPAAVVPVDLSIPEFKEESNLVGLLKESEKKALEEFKSRIEKAIKDREFKVAKKVAETLKEAETPLTSGEPDALLAPSSDVPPADVAETTTDVSPATVAVQSVKVEDVKEKSAASTADTTPVAKEEASTEVKNLDTEESRQVEADRAAPDLAAPKAEETVPTEAVVKDESAPSVADGKEAREDSSPSPEVLKDVPVDEEVEDGVSQEDVSLWGVPLLHTKGDKRTDVILLKFLRARDFSVNEAFNQLKKTIIWRQSSNIDSILNEDFGTDFDNVAFMHGKDKEGRPVCYNSIGVFRDKQLYQKTFGDASKIDAFLRWRIQVLERGIRLLNFTPEGPSAMVQVFDLKNSPGPARKGLKIAVVSIVNLLQDNYPELVAKMVFVNVPWFTSALYSIVSPFISQRTKSKFVLPAAGKATEALFKFISAEYVPVSYGGLGRLDDADFFADESPASEVTVKAGNKTSISIPVTEVGGTVMWDVAVVGYDVSYAAEFVPNAEGAYTTIVEKTKKIPPTNKEPIRNSYKISDPGHIVLTLENPSKKKKLVIFRSKVKDGPSTELVLS